MNPEVVARARTGDHEAFAALAAASIDRLYRIARQVLRDPALAEDAVQETLVEAWRSLPALRDLDRFDAWVHRILVRACSRIRARRSTAHVREIQVEDFEWPAGDRGELDVDTRDQLERGFARLDPDRRALLVLRYALELNAEEIADLLGIPSATVRSRLHRATREMRSALDADARVVTARTGGVE
jgi:RNA polymerase sigma-70 factor (ECF subfamily)